MKEVLSRLQYAGISWENHHRIIVAWRKKLLAFIRADKLPALKFLEIREGLLIAKTTSF